MNPPPPQLPPLQPNEYVTWVHAEKEVFDVAGILLTSLGFTGLCVALATFLGLAMGAARIIRNQREREATGEGRISIQLPGTAEPPA